MDHNPDMFTIEPRTVYYLVVPEKLDFQAANDLNAASSMWQTLKSRCIEMPN